MSCVIITTYCQFDDQYHLQSGHTFSALSNTVTINIQTLTSLSTNVLCLLLNSVDVVFCGKIRNKNRKISGQRYHVAFTASFRAVNKCTVCLQVQGIRSDDLSGVLRRDQNEEQVQNVFKRFLFHYSKARNSVGAVQKESHSVHPLMRLSPKLSQRRKKKVVLLKIRGLPEGML
uniref:Uncharacterized protein n=1 Tax=Oreochromis niloticus TaxID=8128 RepID=A0A669DJE7_ORENI